MSRHWAQLGLGILKGKDLLKEGSVDEADFQSMLIESDYQPHKYEHLCWQG